MDLILTGETLPELGGDRKRYREDLSEEDYIPASASSLGSGFTQGSTGSSSSTYSRGTFGRKNLGRYHKKTYRKKSNSKKRPKSHKSMPRKSKRSRGRRSSAFYYDKVLGKKILRPSVVRTWKKFMSDPELHAWTNDYEPVTTVEQANRLQFGLNSKSATDAQLLNRKMHGYKGAGAYSLGRAWRRSGLGKTVARAGRSLIRAGAAKAISAMSGAGLYGGQGEYNANALISGGRMSVSGGFAGNETDTLTISDCEYVKDIFAPQIASGTSGFASQTIDANPGLAAFAPNLAQIAANFVECEWQQLVFELRPVISESNVNNGLTGAAMMVFNYDPANGNPYDNKEDVMQAHGSVSGRIVDGLSCGVECDPDKVKETEFFIRTGPVPYGRNVDDFDIGQLVIATNNIPAAFSNQQIYELWVYYTVDLRKRKAGAMRLNNQQKDLFVCSGNVATANFPQNQFIAGVDGVCASQQNNIGGLLTSPGQSRFQYTFPPDFNGYVEVRLFIEGAAMTYSGNPSVTLSTGTLSLMSDIYGSTQVAGDTPTALIYNNGTTQAMYIFHLKVKSVVGGNANNFILDTTTNGGTMNQWSLEVMELTSNHFSKPAVPRPVLVNTTDGTIVVPV